MARKRMTLPDGVAPPSGFCECGCGGKTAIAVKSKADRGWYAGYPLRFIHGHRVRTMEHSSTWNGGRWVSKDKRVWIHMPGHHLANPKGYVAEHRLVWEQSNGRRLKRGEVVHHIDGNRTNNAPDNLMAVTQKEHMAIHADCERSRQRISKGLREYFKRPDAKAQQAEARRKAWETRRRKQSQPTH